MRVVTLQKIIAWTVDGLHEDLAACETEEEVPPVRLAAIERLSQWLSRSRSEAIVDEAEKTYRKEEERGKNH